MFTTKGLARLRRNQIGKKMFTTKDTKITKLGSLKYPKPFVSFVNFVVRPYFLIEHSNIGTVARKFAQAA